MSRRRPCPAGPVPGSACRVRPGYGGQRGTSLVLDEFAPILHLHDVYWSGEGQLSVEAVSLAAACLGLALVGFSPFSVRDVRISLEPCALTPVDQLQSTETAHNERPSRTSIPGREWHSAHGPSSGIHALMAEALQRHRAGAHAEATSAGIHPKPLTRTRWP
jgi:hypothetical protein